MEKRFQTIREFSRNTGIGETRVRQWVKQGLVPGWYSGSRYYCDYETSMNNLNEHMRSFPSVPTT